MVETWIWVANQFDRLTWGMAFMKSWKEKYTTKIPETKNNIIFIELKAQLWERALKKAKCCRP